MLSDCIMQCRKRNFFILSCVLCAALILTLAVESGSTFLLHSIQSQSFGKTEKLQLLQAQGIEDPQLFLSEGAELYWGRPEYHPTRWYSLPRNFRGKYHATDDYGMRVPTESEPASAVPLANNKVGFFGGSTAYSTVTDFHHAIPAFISRLSHGKIATENMGIGGYSTSAELPLLIESLRRFAGRFDTIIFYDGVNEVFRELERNQSKQDAPWIRDLGFPYEASTHSALLRQAVPLLFNSSSFQLMDYAMRAYKLRSLVSSVGTTGGIDLQSSADTIARTYWANVHDIKAICESHAIICYFILQPTLYHRQAKSDWELTVYNARHRTLLDISELFSKAYESIRSNIPENLKQDFLDMSGILNDCLPGKSIFYDECHLLNVGNECVARRLYNELFKDKPPLSHSEHESRLRGGNT